MSTSSFLSNTWAKEKRPLQPVKLLIQREDYATCHIKVPEEPQRLSAITLDSKFYSFFRVLEEPTKTLGLLLKLTARGNQVAMTPIRRGYVIWVHEPDGTLVKSPTQTSPNLIQPTLGPADCWVIGDRQTGYRACSLKVPDLADTVLGLADSRQRLYSLYRREKDPAQSLKLAGRLVKRGDEVILLVRKASYIICIYESDAVIVPS
ncbi:MAG: hypothetical protein ACFBSF_00080 [Leptolyngbyaceae cyanobacterium]